MQAFADLGVVGGILYFMFYGFCTLQVLRYRSQILPIWPSFVGLSLTTLSVNAALDFPLQLPTATLTATLLMGGLTALFVRTGMAASCYGIGRTLRLGRAALIGCLGAAAAALFFTLVADWQWRQSSALVKLAKVRLAEGIADDETLRLLEAAKQGTFINPLAKEYFALAHARYQGTRNFDVRDRLAVLDAASIRDPWNSFLLLSIAQQLFILLQVQLEMHQDEEAERTLSRIEEAHSRLRQVIGFSQEADQIERALHALQLAKRIANQIIAVYRSVQVQDPDAPTLQALVTAVSESRLSLDQLRAALTAGPLRMP